MNLKPCEIQRWEGFSQGAVPHSWEQRTAQHPKQLTCRTSQLFISQRRPEHDTFFTFSPPFGIPQPRGSKPSASSPAYKSHSYPPCHDWLLSCCQASCAVREDLGTCGLLRILRALSTQRQQCCCPGQARLPHTALQKWVSARDTELAELNHPHQSCWSVHCTSPVGCRRKGEQGMQQTEIVMPGHS